MKGEGLGITWSNTGKTGKKSPSPMCPACYGFLVMGKTLSPLSGKSPVLWPPHTSIPFASLSLHLFTPSPTNAFFTSLPGCLQQAFSCWHLQFSHRFFPTTSHLNSWELCGQSRHSGLLPDNAGLDLSPVLRTVKVNSPQKCVVCLLLPVNV